jgi:hypothetical protein
MEGIEAGNRRAVIQTIVTTKWPPYSLELVYKANGWADFHDSNGKWKESRGVTDEL